MAKRLGILVSQQLHLVELSQLERKIYLAFATVAWEVVLLVEPISMEMAFAVEEELFLAWV